MNTRRTTDAAGERWRKFGNELPELDPDPLFVGLMDPEPSDRWLERGCPGVFGLPIAVTAAYFQGRDDERATPSSRVPPFLGLLLAALAGAVVGWLVATGWPA